MRIPQQLFLPIQNSYILFRPPIVIGRVAKQTPTGSEKQRSNRSVLIPYSPDTSPRPQTFGSIPSSPVPPRLQTLDLPPNLSLDLHPLQIMYDQYFPVLSTDHRRDLLCSLSTGNRQRVATRDSDPTKTSIRLVHVDLPLLEDRELITWDRKNHSIAKGPKYTELTPLLDCLQAQSTIRN